MMSVVMVAKNGLLQSATVFYLLIYNFLAFHNLLSRPFYKRPSCIYLMRKTILLDE